MNWAKKQANAERVSSSRVMAVGPAQAVTLAEVVAEILAVGAVAISKAEDRGARHAAPPFIFALLLRLYGGNDYVRYDCLAPYIPPLKGRKRNCYGQTVCAYSNTLASRCYNCCSLSYPGYLDECTG